MLDQVADIVKVVVWPALLLAIVLLFRDPLRRFFERLGEFTFKAPGGIEASFKAGRLLGAAEARQSDGEDHDDANSSSAGNPAFDDGTDHVAEVLSEATTGKNARRLREATVLWVDDNPNNNLNERDALKAVGIKTVVSTSTDDALERVRQSDFDAIVSDMGRHEEDGHKPRAGYELLDKLRSSGVTTPFYFYAGSNRQKHKDEAKEHGAQGSTNRPQEIFELVVRAVLDRKTAD